MGQVQSSTNGLPGLALERPGLGRRTVSGVWESSAMTFRGSVHIEGIPTHTGGVPWVVDKRDAYIARSRPLQTAAVGAVTSRTITAPSGSRQSASTRGSLRRVNSGSSVCRRDARRVRPSAYGLPKMRPRVLRASDQGVEDCSQCGGDAVLGKVCSDADHQVFLVLRPFGRAGLEHGQ